MSDVHNAAQQGYGRQAERYRRGRPDYPPELSAWLSDALQLSRASRVLDLGAGTGKFTALLLQTGAEVVAVEPVGAMREQLTRALPQVRVVAASAQTLPFEDGSCDAIVCAQSFHWFANQGALEQMHRVLRPGGRLGLIWNVRDDACEWVAALALLLRAYEQGVPRYASGAWRAHFPSVLFSALRESVFAYEHVGAPEQVIVDRALSMSFIAALPDAEREVLATRLREFIATHAALRGRERIGFPYRTHAYVSLRSDGSSSAR